MAASPDIPATSEVLLKSDASKQFLDTLLGQGWDAWGQGLGGSQAAELMLQLFSAFNIVALATMGGGDKGGSGTSTTTATQAGK